MLQQQGRRPDCPILFTLKYGNSNQVPYANIVNGKSRLDLRRIKQEELIQALQKAKINLFLGVAVNQ